MLFEYLLLWREGGLRSPLLVLFNCASVLVLTRVFGPSLSNQTLKMGRKLNNVKVWKNHSSLKYFLCLEPFQFSSVAQSCQTLCNPMDCSTSGCPSPTPSTCSNSCPLIWWCHPTISSSVVPLSSCLQSFPASGSFPMSQFFTSGGQSIGVSASSSVLPMNIQDWFSLGLTGLISLQSIKKAEGLRIYVFELWYWRRLLRVPCTARRFGHNNSETISCVV